jgi:hypothetical protein
MAARSAPYRIATSDSSFATVAGLIVNAFTGYGTASAEEVDKRTATAAATETATAVTTVRGRRRARPRAKDTGIASLSIGMAETRTWGRILFGIAGTAARLHS